MTENRTFSSQKHSFVLEGDEQLPPSTPSLHNGCSAARAAVPSAAAEKCGTGPRPAAPIKEKSPKRPTKQIAQIYMGGSRTTRKEVIIPGRIQLFQHLLLDAECQMIEEMAAEWRNIRAQFFREAGAQVRWIRKKQPAVAPIEGRAAA